MLKQGGDAGLTTGQVIGGKYRIEELLGAGGMGSVFAATHLDLDERVAIKVLLPGLSRDESTVKRFSREARAAVRIKGEHVVRVLDVGKLESGLPYFVMELFTGADLGELATQRSLSVDEVVDFTLQALRGIAEAHAIGIVHRDLKPSNLFVTTRRDGSNCIKVLDFGISKSTRTDADVSMSLTQTSAVVGSPGFMAPEQWLSAKDVDGRADIWAIGAVMFQLLANRTPFEGETVAQLCAAVLNTPPPSLRERRTDVPEDLEKAILKCLAKDRAARFRDVGELAFALAPFAPQASRVSAESIAATVGSSRDVASAAASSTPSSPQGVTVPLNDSSDGRLSASEPTPPPTPARSAPQSDSINANMLETSLSNVLPPRKRATRLPVVGIVVLAGIALGAIGLAMRERPGSALVEARTGPATSDSLGGVPSASADPSSFSAPSAAAPTPNAPLQTADGDRGTADAVPRVRLQPAAASIVSVERPPSTGSRAIPASPSSPPTFDRADLGGRH